MSFLALYRDKKHKFKNGYWVWNEKMSKLKFCSHGKEPQVDTMLAEAENGHYKPLQVDFKIQKRKTMPNVEAIKPHDEGRLTFVNDIDETEEKIFHDFFKRPKGFDDSDVITIQDIKNLAFFTLKSKILDDLVVFFNTDVYDEFLRAVFVYFNQFLLTIEFLLIRRDELNEANKIRDNYSLEIERFLSKQLSDRRLLIAREYSKVCF